MTALAFKILPNRRKSSGKLGIYISLTHKNAVRYISTEFEIDDDYQFDDGKVCYRNDAKVMNKRMDFVMQQYQNKLDSLVTGNYPSCTRLKEALLRDDSLKENLTLSELFEQRIDRLIKDQRTGYAKMNRESMGTIIHYIGDMEVSCISHHEIKELYRKMKANGYSDGSIQIKMAHLKAAINEAIEERWVRYEDHPFRGFKMPAPGVRMMDITIEQFQAIRDLKTDSIRLKNARDIFLLSFYLGGINLVDLVKVDLSGEDVSYSRTKTAAHKTAEKVTTFRIPDEAREIINRWAPDGHLRYQQTSYKLLQVYLNNCFALLAKHIGITGSFRFYSARKTFTQFAFTIGIKTEVIEYCVGQTMKRNRPIYNYVRVMKKMADTAIQKVIDYTKDPQNFDLYDVV